MHYSQVAVFLLLCLHGLRVEAEPQCGRHGQIPNGWSQDGRDLHQHVHNCTVSSNGSVNVLRILNVTDRLTHRYVSGDVYFNCTDPTITLGK